MANVQKLAGLTRGYGKRWLLVGIAVIVGGCASYASENWNELFGPSEPRQRLVATQSDPGQHYLKNVQPIIEQRCVVCHGCYDSPCQLNLASPQGIDRGASKDKVYDSARLRQAPLSRMFEDAQTTEQWRDMGFYPVLNEHEQTPTANIEASVMHAMLQLKRDNPLPKSPLLPDSFELGLSRKQECPKPSEMDKFAVKKPLWGMPYGLPGLSHANFNTLEQWLEDGALMAIPEAPGPAYAAEIATWETFLNGDSLKQQLTSRYLYEHWFLAHLYFGDVPLEGGLGTRFFKIVRSATPPGQPIELISSRRPYDDPGVKRVYYRFWWDHSTILDKTHMPYVLDTGRMELLQSLFLTPEYTVTELPGYDPEVAANPFVTFRDLPINGRWRFLLVEAQFTVMNFIKGPVCRGQVSLDVIRDNFWVFFENADNAIPESAIIFLNEQEGNLQIPAAAGSNASPISTWNKYSKSQQAWLAAKSAFLNKEYAGGGITLDKVWDGDGSNQNAALTVFRHFDSASVVKGLVGPMPKTAWLIDYSILERIHYLLVAGFDVYGNVGHQLTTRLYMDFLRMEGEFNFLALLPMDMRKTEALEWYKGASKEQQSYVYGSRASFDQPTSIVYQTDDPKKELFGLLQQRLAPVLNRNYELDQADVPASHRAALEQLKGMRGLDIAAMPEAVILNVQTPQGRDYYYTILRNRAHNNITSLFSEKSNLAPEDDTLTVVRGFIGSYPDAYWRVEQENLNELVLRVGQLTDEAAYSAFAGRFGVRRTQKGFWAHSDKVLRAHHAANPLENALLDYNRLENR